MELLLVWWPKGLTWLLIAALVLLIPLMIFLLVMRRMTGSNSGTMPKPKDKKPGWHPDPIGPGERYWDGSHWTEESRPSS